MATTLYHNPNARSFLLIALLDELGADDEVTVRDVSIRRRDGSGAIDPANPHPEGKVPYLVDGDAALSETVAIALHLTERFPAAGIGRAIGDPDWAAMLGWLFWYQGVLMPLVVLGWAGVDNAVVRSEWRDMPAALKRIEAALADGRPYLLGERFSLADLFVAGLLGFAKLAPEGGPLADYVARCEARPSIARAVARDQAAASPA